jgi:hypothetical protein
MVGKQDGHEWEGLGEEGELSRKTGEKLTLTEDK